MHRGGKKQKLNNDDMTPLLRGVSRYAATPLIFALSPGHSDITRFRPWSPIATGSRLHRA